jgi:hypothetical protein
VWLLASLYSSYLGCICCSVFLLQFQPIFLVIFSDFTFSGVKCKSVSLITYFVDTEEITLVHLGQIPMAHSMQLPLYIVGRTTNNGTPQTSFHMMSLFRRHRFHRYCDVLEVVRSTSRTWKDRRLERGKRDVWNVARLTSRTWQERCLERGKTDVLNVARETS